MAFFIFLTVRRWEGGIEKWGRHVEQVLGTGIEHRAALGRTMASAYGAPAALPTMPHNDPEQKALREENSTKINHRCDYRISF